MSDMGDFDIHDVLPEEPPKFKAGQLVQHKRYRYRGVVVDFDLYCKASEDWYQSNPTQPERQQPWYHVLVDGSTYVTYVAQPNLEPDETGQPVHHPLVPHLFEDFRGDGYERNDTPWPGWEAADSDDSDADADAEEDDTDEDTPQA